MPSIASVLVPLSDHGSLEPSIVPLVSIIIVGVILTAVLILSIVLFRRWSKGDKN